MSRNLWDSLFTDCYCKDCCYSDYDDDKEQFYCRIDNRYRDVDDSSPCSNYEE